MTWLVASLNWGMDRFPARGILLTRTRRSLDDLPPRDMMKASYSHPLSFLSLLAVGVVLFVRSQLP